MRKITPRILPAIVLGYQLVALFVFAVAAILANQWLQRPFIGAFVEQTLMISDIGDWELDRQLPGFGYQIVELNGIAMQSSRQLGQEISRYQIGEQVNLTIKHPNGELKNHQVSLQTLPAADRVKFFYIPYFTGLFYLSCSLWVFSLQRRKTAARAFSIFATSVAIGIAGLFDIYTTNTLVYLWTFAMAVLGGSLISLALIFPEEVQVVEKQPPLRWVGYLPSIGLVIFSTSALFNTSSPTLYVSAWRLIYLYIVFGGLVFLLLTAYRGNQSISAMAREQARLILAGALVSFTPILSWFLLTLLKPDILFSPYLLVFFIVFPAVVAYTILRYRILKTDYLVSRGILYALLAAFTITAYALFVAGTTLIVKDSHIAESPYAIGAFVFLLAVILNPLKNWLQARIDTVFSRGQAAYREQLEDFSKDLTQSVELSEILRILRRYTEQNLHPIQTHIFIIDPLTDHYAAAPASGQKPTSDLRFPASSPLVEMLAKQRTAIFIGEYHSLPAALQNEKARLDLLGAQLFIPLPGQEHLTGWLALSARQTGEPYNERDLSFLESLNDQAALAIERAQVVDNLERRMHEMNVLTRVSQGINVTLAFDDILELIYAQTNQIIPTLDFCVTLYDQYSNYLYHVFYLENDDRVNSRENVPLRLGQGLEYEIIQNRRGILTDDYERECRSRGVLSAVPGLLAWMGVPMNAGAETIGLISLGSRDPSVTYTAEQENLLKAIADQAAGAIVKGRLLQESERRTRQLTTLNEVARSLTSTLELDRLLNQILNSAVEILNCEAGSLLLPDEQTDELIFTVVTGPVAKDLQGTRLPPKAGLAGKSVETRQPVIANDVRRTKEWFHNTDQQTGFNTEDVLVVPMLIKERVIGVIEVINRKDGLPFTPDDQELLAAFTSQAAVAIENARLYTMTDQALAARVEELSVMQRIDRELNASLDASRTMRITLTWAMRQSHAEAGLVGVVEGNALQVMASQGYTDELEAYQNNPLPLALPALQEAVEDGQVKWVQSNGSEGKTGLLATARCQVAVPIRRETEVIGLLILENSQGEIPPEETMAFLSRLSDHAAIALANARLYDAVQAANRAKSDFVSFVSHELKTPMTSIRGFTDLLASGVVGQVNEAQGNFLSTIRSNVDRMATLVSDLADVSRIEAGRLRLDFAPVKIHEVVEEVVRSVRAQVDERQQVLDLQIPTDLPYMWGDRMRIIQVLTNLASNAYKYSPPGGQITICAEAVPNRWLLVDGLTVEGEVQEGGSKVIHVIVQDSGFGIKPEDQAKIFQKFFRADDQKVRDAPGTGLGLNITKTLVEMQGGHIWFVSEFRKGTAFHFTIPVAETA